MPPILDEETAEILETGADNMLTALEVVISGNLIIGVLLGFGLSQLMGLLRLL